MNEESMASKSADNAGTPPRFGQYQLRVLSAFPHTGCLSCVLRILIRAKHGSVADPYDIRHYFVDHAINKLTITERHIILAGKQRILAR